ncbi:hypothetical protein PHYSODRAFT_332140 [Phytophthora sojae]|uniref:Uncharacterized protein n=1 Tax=Phytophthora sojae (strain P6497) TaxID=1094619 RepID=G4ZCW0_PHYSP|nr:hypothetical protein PHYSODRAFT_332140 [Phytophthora sojae]EGZ18318.1 hypothetical protein PHYSODRAFT_332140 [Phytophthora sojae]|eukprot:XP_009527376.1 hypothetical protein PHYSODRAFT_332140 [Phytophthora sojae]
MSDHGRSPPPASSARSSHHVNQPAPDPPGPDPLEPHSEELRALVAARDTAMRNQEEVAALLLHQTRELDAAQAHIQRQNAELSSLQAEDAVHRSQGTTSVAGAVRALQLQGRVAQQVGEIRDLQRHIERLERERDRLQENNDYLASEVSLAGAEIQQLQSRNASLERDLEDANDERDVAEHNMDRAQEALRRVEEELGSRSHVPQIDPQQIEALTRDRDRDRVSLAEVTRSFTKAQEDLRAHQRMHNEARDELNRLRAVHMATLADLDRAVQERDTPELTHLQDLQETAVADLARVYRERDAYRDEVTQVRLELKDLQADFDASEQTVTTLGQRVSAIESQRQSLAQDLIRMSHERDGLQEEVNVALWQLSSISRLADARPGAIEEVVNPAYILSLIRVAPPGSAEQQPTAETSDRDCSDPVPNQQMASSASKRDRGRETPDPDPTPLAKCRIFSPQSESREALDRGDGCSSPAKGSEIADDGGLSDSQRGEGSDQEDDRGDKGNGDGHEEEDHNELEEQGNDDGEDEETESMANDLFEAQTLEALSQSRSEERRRQHASPRRRPSSGAGRAPDDGDGSDPHEDPDPTPPQDPDPRNLPPARARRPPVQDLLAPVVPFAPDADCIPGRENAHALVPTDCQPWQVDHLNDAAMVTMLIDVLFPILPTAPGWLFPYFGPAEGRKPKIQLNDYCWELITEENVRAQLDTHPWEILENPGDAISFEVKSTHHFPIPDAMAKKYPWLIVFQKERRNRRSLAGRALKQFLELLITVMREGWCDLDILLNPHFLHFPKQPTHLLEALDECNNEDPWRNHYRDTPQYHPARNIARLSAKFFNLRAVGDQ